MTVLSSARLSESNLESCMIRHSEVSQTQQFKSELTIEKMFTARDRQHNATFAAGTTDPCAWRRALTCAAGRAAGAACRALPGAELR